MSSPGERKTARRSVGSLTLPSHVCALLSGFRYHVSAFDATLLYSGAIHIGNMLSDIQAPSRSPRAGEIFAVSKVTLRGTRGFVPVLEFSRAYVLFRTSVSSTRSLLEIVRGVVRLRIWDKERVRDYLFQVLRNLHRTKFGFLIIIPRCSILDDYFSLFFRSL